MEARVVGEPIISSNNSSYSSVSHNLNLMDNTSNSVTPGSSVDLEDLEILQVAKKQLRYSQRRSLVLKSRLQEEESRTRTEFEESEDSQSSSKRTHWRSNSCPDALIANQLDTIESQINKTDKELSRMKRRSVDILVGRHCATDSYGKIEKTINDLAAKKRDLEAERFDAWIELQSQLMTPNIDETEVGKTEHQHIVNTKAKQRNPSTSACKRSIRLYSANEEKLAYEDCQESPLNKRLSFEADSSAIIKISKAHIPNDMHVHKSAITGRELS